MSENDSKQSSSELDSIEVQEHLERIRDTKAASRRGFMKNVGLGAVSVAAGSVLTSCLGSGHLVSAAGPPQADVLNFALNLEYLEAEFYSYAVNGTGLGSSDTGGTGTVTGGAKVNFTDSRLADIAKEIASDELNHVRFLRSALGSAAVPQPNINLNALGIGFANDAQFLTLARAFEDTGVSAYGGAATFLSGDYLQAAAQILAVEAYHAGNLRLECVENGVTTPALDSQDVPPTEQAFFPEYPNTSLAIIRTTSQVLAIVYANAAPGTMSGGFFPNGLNGNIKTV